VSPFALRRRLRDLAARAPVVACSAYVARSLIAAGVPAARVRVVHPVPPESDTPIVPRPRAPRLLVVGQLIRGKGFDLAIEALAHLPYDLTLELAGDGPDRALLEARARRVAPGRVHFAGYVSPSAIEAHYDAASLVLVPSRWPEPFGMVGIEAMRRARPVVAAAHGGIPEWLPPESAGRLVEPGSPEALARGVRALLADATAGDRAAAFVRARFTHERTVMAIERLLGELCSAAEVAA
jgi:glycosyltransferase involved in cell wall biosynthesis